MIKSIVTSAGLKIKINLGRNFAANSHVVGLSKNHLLEYPTHNSRMVEDGNGFQLLRRVVHQPSLTIGTQLNSSSNDGRKRTTENTIPRGGRGGR